MKTPPRGCSPVLASRVLPLLVSAVWAVAAPGPDYHVYVGTYTGKESRGIYRFRLEAATGTLKPEGLAAATDSPSFLAVHPGGRFLFAVNQTADFPSQPGGGVSGFAVDPLTGGLSLVNQQPSGGAGPCHLTLDRTGRTLVLANYSGGSVTSLPVDATGRLGPAASFHQHLGSSVNPRRQEKAHAHGVYVTADNRFVLVPDLGLDQVVIYRLDPATSRLEPQAPPGRITPGSGPRHLALHPTQPWVYVVNELSNTVTGLRFDASAGRLEEFQTIGTLPSGYRGQSSTAEIEVHPQGRLLYASNRGHDSLASFRIDPATGRLTALGHVPVRGQVPRGFALDPAGRWLIAAHQNSHSLALFRVDGDTGQLAPLGEPLPCPSPVSVVYLPVP